MTVSINTKERSISSSSSENKLDLNKRQTPWKSIWIVVYMQFVVGLLMSIFYMSTWPYLSRLDPSANFHFTGVIVAAGSFGCSIANPIFGYWNQRTMSVITPTVFGFVVACFGQILYALLPLFSFHPKWLMIASRLIIGFGTGSIAVLRAYIAMAAIPEDKLKAIAYSTGCWVLGLSLGPSIQSAFTSIEKGWNIFGYRLDLYTLPPYFMIVVSLFSCLIMWLYFEETYAGVINEKDEGAISIPKYDLPPALVCIWLWICSCMMSTNIEVLSTPLSTAMYGWNDSKSILWNGVLTSITSLISVCINFIIGSTKIGMIDKRKQILFGLSVFFLYHFCNYPWSFYPGPLSYIPEGITSSLMGGCERSYLWCSSSVAIPLPIYITSFILCFGIAFPFIGSPSASLYTEILGPRPQGIMQGLYSFGGSIAQFIAPIFATFLFQHTGYRYVILTQLGILFLGFILVILYFRRLVPLELERKTSTDKKRFFV